MVTGQAETARIRRVCAWCKKIIEEGILPPTHGICHECATSFMRAYEDCGRSASSQEEEETFFSRSERRCTRADKQS